jgi:hypothetical protein
MEALSMTVGILIMEDRWFKNCKKEHDHLLGGMRSEE